MGSRMSEMESGTVAERPGRGPLIVILLVVLALVAGAALIVNQDRGVDNLASVVPTSMPEDDRPATYTEQYWKMAESAATTTTADLSRFTTAPGWEQALESSNLSDWGPDQEYDLLLEEKKYYSSTIAPHANPAVMNESGADRAEAIDAYYTERYWKLAGQAGQPDSAGEREWDRPTANPRAPTQINEDGRAN